MTIVGCKSCGARIFYAATKAGKRIPINAVPDPKGNLVVRRAADGTVRAVPAKEAQPEELHRHTSHFATCPDAADHRRSR